MDASKTLFIKDDIGWYVCGCGHSTILPKIELHMSPDFPGYCSEGIRVGKTKYYQCICGSEFDDQETCEKHILKKESKCMENALKYKSRSCNICDLEFRGCVELTRHNQTKGHIQKLSGTYKEVDLFCKLCNIKCLSRNLMEKHLQTKKHLNKLNEPSLDLECKVCNIKCLSQKQMKAHLATKKHIKNESSKQ